MIDLETIKETHELMSELVEMIEKKHSDRSTIVTTARLIHHRTTALSLAVKRAETTAPAI